MLQPKPTATRGLLHPKTYPTVAWENLSLVYKRMCCSVVRRKYVHDIKWKSLLSLFWSTSFAWFHFISFHFCRAFLCAHHTELQTFLSSLSTVIGTDADFWIHGRENRTFCGRNSKHFAWHIHLEKEKKKKRELWFVTLPDYWTLDGCRSAGVNWNCLLFNRRKRPIVLTNAEMESF